MPTNDQASHDLAWAAFRYVAEEMNPIEAAAFEEWSVTRGKKVVGEGQSSHLPRRKRYLKYYSVTKVPTKH